MSTTKQQTVFIKRDELNQITQTFKPSSLDTFTFRQQFIELVNIPAPLFQQEARDPKLCRVEMTWNGLVVGSKLARDFDKGKGELWEQFCNDFQLHDLKTGQRL